MACTGDGPGDEESLPGRALHDEAVHGELVAIREQLAVLVHEATRAGEHARVREQVIAHQRAQLDELAALRRGSGLRPLAVGLAKLRADLLVSARECRDDGSVRLAGVLTHHADAVESILEAAGVDRLALEAGDEFDAARHAVAATVPCEPARHRRVVNVVADGWCDRETGRVLAAAKVVVGRHVPDVPKPADGGDPTHIEEPADG